MRKRGNAEHSKQTFPWEIRINSHLCCEFAEFFSSENSKPFSLLNSPAHCLGVIKLWENEIWPPLTRQNCYRSLRYSYQVIRWRNLKGRCWQEIIPPPKTQKKKKAKSDMLNHLGRVKSPTKAHLYKEPRNLHRIPKHSGWRATTWSTIFTKVSSVSHTLEWLTVSPRLGRAGRQFSQRDWACPRDSLLLHCSRWCAGMGLMEWRKEIEIFARVFSDFRNEDANFESFVQLSTLGDLLVDWITSLELGERAIFLEKTEKGISYGPSVRERYVGWSPWYCYGCWRRKDEGDIRTKSYGGETWKKAKGKSWEMLARYSTVYLLGRRHLISHWMRRNRRKTQRLGIATKISPAVSTYNLEKTELWPVNTEWDLGFNNLTWNKQLLDGSMLEQAASVNRCQHSLHSKHLWEAISRSHSRLDLVSQTQPKCGPHSLLTWHQD